MGMTIDCETCPVRGRHCGDCIVPLLGRTWLEGPARRPEPSQRPEPSDADGPSPASLPLDFEEMEAVEAFAHAGLISRVEAHEARAQSTWPWVAVG